MDPAIPPRTAGVDVGRSWPLGVSPLPQGLFLCIWRPLDAFRLDIRLSLSSDRARLRAWERSGFYECSWRKLVADA